MRYALVVAQALGIRSLAQASASMKEGVSPAAVALFVSLSDFELAFQPRLNLDAIVSTAMLFATGAWISRETTTLIRVLVRLSLSFLHQQKCLPFIPSFGSSLCDEDRLLRAEVQPGSTCWGHDHL